MILILGIDLTYILIHKGYVEFTIYINYKDYTGLMHAVLFYFIN